MNEQKDNMQTFIDFIIELAYDEFDYCVEAVHIRKVTMSDYFFSKGSLELAKVLQYFIPKVQICSNETENHFVIKFNENYYDAKQRYTTNQGFQEVSLDFIKRYEEYYGKDVLFEGKPVHLALIQELKNCSGDYVSNLIDAINNEEPTSRKLVTKVPTSIENK